MFQAELRSRRDQWAGEHQVLANRVAALNKLIAYADAVLEADGKAISTKRKAKSVADAVATLIDEGPVSVSELMKRIPAEFGLNPKPGAITATLSYNTRKGTYHRLERGYYIKVVRSEPPR